ncbi:MAG: adenylosuccinate lyase [Promethearchaeia archaeon]
MPVNPIDYGRYGHPDMVQIFEEQYRHSLWLRIEKTVARVQAKLGLIPKEAARDIEQSAVPEQVTLERTKEIEKRTRHDVAALYEAIAEKCDGAGSRWIHFGLTSNDVKDTTKALQMKKAFEELLIQLESLAETIMKRAEETTELIAVGRTHGQHAVPITYGIRFAVWLDEVRRHIERLVAAKKRATVGKIAGATGSHAALGKQGLEVQNRVLDELELGVPTATTQIIQRDRYAEAILVLCNLASTIDKIATDLRNLQRTEIAETFEPFVGGEQIGSSAMPHKRNPITCEKLSGLARIVRSFASPALETVISWEERDLANSSAERFVLPQAFILVDYMVRELNRIVDGLIIDEERVIRNVAKTNQGFLSEYLVTTLTKAGLERPKAHEMLRKAAIESRKSEESLIDTLKRYPEVSDFMDSGSLDVDAYYDSIRETSREIVKRVISTYTETITVATK